MMVRKHSIPISASEHKEWVKLTLVKNSRSTGVAREWQNRDRLIISVYEIDRFERMLVK